MVTKRIVGFVVSAALIGVASHAMATPTAGGRTAVAKITRVFASGDGTTLVSLSGNKLTNGVVCSPQSRYSIAPAAANSKSGLATILTARALDANVQFDITACDDNGAASPSIFNVILQ